MNNEYNFHKHMDGFDFFAPSHNPHKKYDVLFLNSITGKINKVSFGDINYQQYHDTIGYYAYLDHNDEIRRRAYKSRHKHDKLLTLSSGFFSYYYLW